MRRQYVLDTSVLIEDPYAFESFPHSDVIIPITVLNELDSLKKQPGEAGKHARVCIKVLDEITEKGDVNTGILLEDDILLQVDTVLEEAPPGFGDPKYGDTQILLCAFSAWKKHPTKDVTLVSNDINLKIKARSRGLEATSHQPNKKTINDIYTGHQTVVDEEMGAELQQQGFIDPRICGLSHLNLNECAAFINKENTVIALGRKTSFDKLKLIKKTYPWNLSPRNKEQAFAIDLIMDKNIDLVTLVGTAGTGKTLSALAAATELVVNRKEYNKLIVYRPTVAVDEGVGWLPGELADKLAPWMQPVKDNFEILLGDKWKVNLDHLVRKGVVEFDALSFVRGRSISNAVILVDEIQNISREQVKTILTRAGEKTKVILTGDPDQIDKNDLDITNNGLVYAVEKFKNYAIAGHIFLTQGERSRLATLAANIL